MVVDFHSQLDTEKTTVVAASSSPRPAGPDATAAYEQYLRLAELSHLWNSRNFPDWKGEAVLKPALQALEITFRFISTTTLLPSDDNREWSRRLESLATRELEIVAALCEDRELTGSAPTCRLGSSPGVLKRDRSSQEVWKIPGSSPLVWRTSEESLLPRLAAWDKSEGVASKLQMEVECKMSRAPFTLGLGEPNLSGKPNLDYDLVCSPSRLHALALARRRYDGESSLHTSHQIMETWVLVGKQLLLMVEEGIRRRSWEEAATHCWLLERVWKLLVEVEDLHMLMDPDDFLRLKQRLGIKASSGSEAFCFRSTALMDLTVCCSRGLKKWVPEILGVEADPEGGPRLQEAAMELFRTREKKAEVHLVQAFQAVDAAVKKFFFAYRQLIVVVMGSVEAAAAPPSSCCENDSLKHIFMEPPYFPSLDAAKIFLADLYQRSL